MLQNNIPCHRLSGFIILIISLLFDVAGLFPVHDFFSFGLYACSIAYYSIFIWYTWFFLRINHYTDIENKHISSTYIQLIQNATNVKIRMFLLITYYVLFFCSWSFPTYMPYDYSQLTSLQKTIFAYNYTMASFTIMYIYEHKNMHKYLSLSNVVIYDSEDQPILNNLQLVPIVNCLE